MTRHYALATRCCEFDDRGRAPIRRPTIGDASKVVALENLCEPDANEHDAPRRCEKMTEMKILC